MKRLLVCTVALALALMPALRTSAQTYTPQPFAITLLNGDCNNDNVVEDQDYSILGNAWYSSFGDSNFDIRADLNGDGVVEDQDYSIMGLNWYSLGNPEGTGPAFATGTRTSPGGNFQILGTVHLQAWQGGPNYPVPMSVEVQAQSQQNQSMYYWETVCVGTAGVGSFTMNVPAGVYTVEAWFTTEAPQPKHWLRECVYNIDLDPPFQGTASVAAYTSTAPVTVTYTGAIDNSDGTPGSGINHVELWYEGPTGGWINSTVTATGTSGTFAFTPPGNAPGTYYFATRAEDNAGNWSPIPSGVGDCSAYYEAGLGICQFSSILSP